MRFFLTVIAIMLMAGICTASEHAPVLRDAGSLGGIRLAGSDDPGIDKIYIVQLTSPSLAHFHASRTASPSRAATAAKTPPRFDKTRADVLSHAAKLIAEQDRILAEAGANVELVYRYQYSLNGFAARMQPGTAHKLASMPGVAHVWEDEIRPLATNFSLDFLNLFDAENGLRGAAGLDGEGIVIGFIDSGIAPEHPALRDTRAADRPRICQGSWAENSLLGRWLCRRFDKRADTILFEPPENWNGSCQAGERFAETDCNNKLIGARYFIDGAENSGPLDAGEIRSARDVDGHGTHTATTAAGNRVNASIFRTFIGPVQGIAPRARVAVYKACWLRPGDSRASCNTSDLANAIDAAVGDGVDVINYSVGSSMRELNAPDDVALLAATKAGIFTVVAAGNEGPNLGTIGSPAGAPWVLTTAASSRDGENSVEAIEVTRPPVVAGKYAVREANFTPPLEDRDPLEASLVLADDDDETLADSTPGTTSDACEALVNDADMDGNIAFIQRGGCEFDIKIANAEDAGAIAAIIYNIAGDPIVMNGTPGLSDIPALMIGQADGNLLLAELDAGNDVNVILDKSLLLTTPDDGNVMGGFSARGPGPSPDILKPDVTAPGINILAGFTPDAANAMSGENFAYLTGTSMSTPHVAGVAALLRQAHPEWTPAAVKSALMTTARQTVTGTDGQTPANPFDFGAGHIVPNDALEPGLVFDVSGNDYDAYACGTASPGVDAARCDQLEASGLSFAAADLNQPSIAVSRLASERTVRRTVTNTGDGSDTYLATITAPAGIAVIVEPATISLAPGQSTTYDVTLRYESGPLDLWRFGSITWDGDRRSAFSALAVRPVSVSAPAEVTAIGADGSGSFPVRFGYTGIYTPRVHGLRLPLIINGFVDDDPTKTFSFRTVNGVTAHLIDVPADQLYLRFALFDALTDGNDDLDMFVYLCPDNLNCNRIGESGNETSEEEFNVLAPAAGRYAVLIHGFETDNVAGGPGANYQLLAWSFGVIDDQGNMTASGPPSVTAGTTENVIFTWSGLASNTIYLGGISHNTPQGLSALTIIRIGN